MKKALLTIAMIFGATTAAHAEGFVCETQDGVLKVQVYHHVQASEGTRVPAIMILSDNTVQSGRKTIATFEAGQTLDGSAMNYVANVDLRYKNSKKKGEYLLGTRLGELDQVVLNVDFTYSQPIEDGADVSGVISATKRDGSTIDAAVECTRYLKN
jgi:hypothetical protein